MPRILRPIRLIERLQRPWISALLAAFLIADASRLPCDWPTRVSSVAEFLRGQARGTLCAVSDLAAEVDGDWRFVEPHVFMDSHDLSRTRAAFVTRRYGVRESGFWWPLTRERFDRIDIFAADSSALLSQADIRAIRALYCDRIQLPALEPIRFSDQYQQHTLWIAAGKNTLAGLCSLLLALSLAWVARVPRALRALFGTKSGCRRCHYDLSGLREEAACPECGAPAAFDSHVRIASGPPPVPSARCPVPSIPRSPDPPS